MKRFWFAPLAAAILASVGLTSAIDAGDKKDEKKQDTGWVQLFNGKDIEGWKTFDPKQQKTWYVKDGILYSSGKQASHLFSPRDDYENFHFRIEAKISDKGNSGQYFRTKFGGGYPKGYEAQINSNFPDPQKTGSLYGFAPIKEMLVPAGYLVHPGSHRQRQPHSDSGRWQKGRRLHGQEKHLYARPFCDPATRSRGQRSRRRGGAEEDRGQGIAGDQVGIASSGVRYSELLGTMAGSQRFGVPRLWASRYNSEDVFSQAMS